jgi:formate/nitrite transporter FocA (FNT family)
MAVAFGNIVGGSVMVAVVYDMSVCGKTRLPRG